MRPALLAVLPFALLVACGSTNSPSISTDFPSWGVPVDGIEVPSDDVVDDETGPRDVPTVDDTVVGSDVGPDATVDDLQAGDPGTQGCQDGDVRGVPCGLNGNGQKPESCAGGQWIDGGPCVDPDACKNRDTQPRPCGLNNRGTVTIECVNGQWAPGVCLDPDVCVDGTSNVAKCGGNSAGRQAQQCQKGSWVPDGPCVLPGRWACQNNECTPLFGDKACGDGTCDPWIGESRTSCPVDCDPGNAQGQGQPCNDAIDCVFYDWPAKGSGYWECVGFLRRTCNAAVTDMYCGTNGYDYCYFDTTAMETDRSCPVDCTPQFANCGSDIECIYQQWPAP